MDNQAVRLILLMVCHVLCIWHTVPACAEAEELTFSIKSEKSIYREAEFNSLNGVLTNVSTRSLWLNTRFSFPGPEVYLVINNSAGETFEWLPSEVMEPLSRKSFIKLLPGKSVLFVIEDIRAHLNRAMTPDSYSVKAIYTNKSGSEFGVEAWQGKVISNSVNLRVVKDAAQ